MISELFICTASGETIVWKKYLPKITVNSRQVFLDLLKSNAEVSLPPHVVSGSSHYFHIKRQSLYFVAVTQSDHLPVFVIELLSKVHQLLKDFCGVVTEASLKANIVLVYEVIEELLDGGLVQLSSTDRLKPYIQSEPVPVKDQLSLDTPNLFGVEQRSVPGTAADKPVIRSRWEQETRKNEIFVDVIERISAVIAANSSVVRCEVVGHVSMKSFLIGSLDIRIGLNEDLTIGREEQRRGYGGMVHLDDCKFHECVNLEAFPDTRILTVRPPEGEFSLMKYHLHGELPHGLPFRLQSYITDDHNTRDLELTLTLRCDVSSSCHAVNVSVSLPVPKSTTGLSQRLSGPGQTAEFVAQEKRLQWKIKKIFGKSEVTAVFKLFQPGVNVVRRQELGPAVLDFELSGITPSNLQVRFLRVFDREHSYVPMRWLRYITTADSYVFRINQ